MLSAYAVDYVCSWDLNMPLVEFAYNSSYQVSIRMAPFEALHGRHYRMPAFWDDVGERELSKVELIDQTNEVVKTARKQLQASPTR